MNAVTEADIQEIIDLELELGGRSLRWFTSKAFKILEPKREFIPGWHIDAICEHLEACVNGEIRELVINIPPRHMKSILVSVMFPAWVWILGAEKRFLYSSYAKSLSIRDSVKTRRIIQHPWYQARWGDRFSLTGDQNAKEKFENDKLGYRMATSVDGTGTGEGGDFIIADDPHKVREAESKIQREGVLSWWDDEMSSRENDPKTGCKIIVMQRVHEADLSGHVLKQGGYEHLMLPAEFEPERKCVTCIGWEDPRVAKGELLWSERFDIEAIERLKRRLPPRQRAGQLQQRPAPESGDIFQRQWWRYYKDIPERFDKMTISADLTFKDTEKSDFCAFGVWIKKEENYYLVEVIKDRMGYNEQLRTFKTLCEKYPDATEKLIEDAANGQALVQATKNTISGTILVLPQGSKVARAEACSIMMESGNVWLPDPSTHLWVNDYIEEHAVFPNGANDDQVDMTSQYLNRYLKKKRFDTQMNLPTLKQKSKFYGR